MNDHERDTIAAIAAALIDGSLAAIHPNPDGTTPTAAARFSTHRIADKVAAIVTPAAAADIGPAARCVPLATDRGPDGAVRWGVTWYDPSEAFPDSARRILARPELQTIGGEA